MPQRCKDKGLRRSTVRTIRALVFLTTGLFFAVPASAMTPEEADAIMTNEIRVKIVGCAVPGVTRIHLDGIERCTLDIPGEKWFVYDTVTRKLIDPTGSSTTTAPAPTVTPATTVAPAPSGPRIRSQTAIKYGDIIDSSITSASPNLEASTGVFDQVRVTGPGDSFTFQANAGDQITIQTTPQGGLKTFVALNGPSGSQVASDSDGNLRYTAATAGNYRIVVIGDSGTQGAYSLKLNGVRGANIATNSRTYTQRMRTAFTGSTTCLVLGNSNQLIMDPCDNPNLPGQTWRFDRSPVPGYALIKTASPFGGELCLQAVNNGLSTAQCNNSINQLWNLRRDGNYFKLRANATGGRMCLDTDSSGSQPRMAECGNFSGQLWQISR